MVGRFLTVGLTKTTLSFPGTVSISPTPVGMHGVKEVRNVMGRSDVDMTQGGIPTEILKMEKRIKMVGTEVITGP